MRRLFPVVMSREWVGTLNMPEPPSGSTPILSPARAMASTSTTLRRSATYGVT